MKSFSLTLLLFVCICLAADNSNNVLVQGKNKFGDVLKPYVDFDVSTYTTELKRKYFPIEKTQEMSTDELTKLEIDSKKWLLEAQSAKTSCEEYIHAANLALISLLLKGRQTAVQHSAFDSWKASGFSASQFFALVKECVHEHSDNWKNHIEFLALGAMEWHQNTELYYKKVKGNESSSNYHRAQHIAIDFIYHTKVKLNSLDSAKLDECISSGSPYSIRQLARRIAASNDYKWVDLKIIQFGTSSVHDDIIDNDQIFLMACLFCEEIRLFWRESNLMNPENQNQGPGITFDVNSALRSTGANEIVNAFEQCCIGAAAAGNRDAENCVEALQYLRNISFHKHTIDLLTSRLDLSADNQHTTQHKNVVEPALLHLNSKFFLKTAYNNEFMKKLINYNIYSYEEALAKKRDLKQKDLELYKRLLIIEKCRDYERHKDGIAFIRDDFANLNKKYNKKDDNACPLVNIIVDELLKDNNGELCFFGSQSKKLFCNSPRSKDALMRIFNNKKASKMLLKLCLNVASGTPVSTAISDAVSDMHKSHFGLELLRALTDSVH